MKACQSDARRRRREKIKIVVGRMKKRQARRQPLGDCKGTRVYRSENGGNCKRICVQPAQWQYSDILHLAHSEYASCREAYRLQNQRRHTPNVRAKFIAVLFTNGGNIQAPQRAPKVTVFPWLPARLPCPGMPVNVGG